MLLQRRPKIFVPLVNVQWSDGMHGTMHAAVVYEAAAAQKRAERGLPINAGASGFMLKLLPPFLSQAQS
jgi:hypothetical protein